MMKQFGGGDQAGRNGKRKRLLKAVIETPVMRCSAVSNRCPETTPSSRLLTASKTLAAYAVKRRLAGSSTTKRLFVEPEQARIAADTMMEFKPNEL